MLDVVKAALVNARQHLLVRQMAVKRIVRWTLFQEARDGDGVLDPFQLVKRSHLIYMLEQLIVIPPMDGSLEAEPLLVILLLAMLLWM